MKNGTAAPPPRLTRGTPVSRRKGRFACSPVVVLFTVVVVVVLAVVLLRRPRVTATLDKKGPPRSSSPTKPPPGGHDVVPLPLWEMDFDCPLWVPDIVSKLQTPPFLLEMPGLLIKQSVVGNKEYRTLMFDLSAEVQGSVVLNVQTGKHNFSDIVLEYTRTMAFACAKVPGLSCDSEGRALSIGLGVGTMANFVRTALPHFHVDVVEIDPNIVDAARKFLGTPPEGTPRFKVHIGDAKDVWDLVGPDARYDIIIHDAYRPGPEIPPSLVTPEYVAQLAARLTERGIVVFNFCTPFYDKDEQIALLQPFRASFKHLWMFEATSTSKILVAHNFDIQSPERATQAFAAQYGALAESPCQWPKRPRSAGYQLYLEPHNWTAQWLRSIHEEASRHYCAQGVLNPHYCKWFTPRDTLLRMFPTVGQVTIDNALVHHPNSIESAKEEVLRAIDEGTAGTRKH